MGKVKRRVNDSVTNRPRGSVLTWGSLEIKMNLLTFKSESCLEVTPPCDCALVKQSGYFKRMHKFVITFLEVMSTIAIKVVQLFFQWTYRGSIGARSFVSRMPRGTWEHTEGISNAARACSWGGSRGSVRQGGCRPTSHCCSGAGGVDGWLCTFPKFLTQPSPPRSVSTQATPGAANHSLPHISDHRCTQGPRSCTDHPPPGCQAFLPSGSLSPHPLHSLQWQNPQVKKIQAGTCKGLGFHYRKQARAQSATELTWQKFQGSLDE